MGIETESSSFSLPWIRAMDYLPIASTITNAAILWNKSISKGVEEKALSTHAFRPLVRESNSYWRNIILLFPFVGNLIVTIFDAYAKFRGNKLLSKVHVPIKEEDIPELRSAAEYGNLQAMVRMVRLAKERNSIAGPHEVVTWYHAISHSGNREALESLQNEGISYNALAQPLEAEKSILRIRELSQKDPADKALEPKQVQQLIDDCLSSTLPEAENTLIDFCNKLAETSRPEALEWLEKIWRQGTPKEKVNVAINIIKRSLHERKPMGDLLDFAVKTCEKNLNDEEVRDALIRLYRDKRYEKRKEAFSLLSLMAQRLNDRDAMSTLGERYLDGPECDEADAWGKAIFWFQSAGNFLFLGHIFLESPNPSDQKEAFDAFKNGARAGDDSCKLYLAECFLKGTGTAQNEGEAKALLDSLKGTPTADAYQSKIELLYKLLYKQHFPELFKP